VRLADEQLIRSAHDCSDGGLAVTLAECCFGTGGIGAQISLESMGATRDERLDDAVVLFGGSASRVVVSAAPDDMTAVLQLAARFEVPAEVSGETGGNALRIAVGGRPVLDVSVVEAERVWSTGIDRHFVRRVA